MTVEASKITVVKNGNLILDDVSFAAPAGKVTALIGPNGAGKSTLLAAISGDSRPTTGSVSLNGIDVLSAPPTLLAQTRSVMLQDVSVAFSFLVRDVVEMGRTPWSKQSTPEMDRTIVDAALATAGVAHLEDRDVTTLSGGERARVAFARILAQQTPIAILDEPTAAMDIRFQESTMGTVRRLADAGRTVIVVLHDLQAAATYCDKVVCLNRGKVAAAGSVHDVYSPEILSEVYQWPINVEHTPSGLYVRPERDDRIEEHTSVLFSKKFAPEPC
ncbi:heme ABC transporter ATP-binding protein [Corynebacterium urinipleomorphum]|uniref:heme ABC transporter ATP-binding protein n=1 Tax=Corynebacterium urinipleomorphum TaxID=1852380 RepID=UPI000B362E29|nr:heme ABC transporter ATP-binding protein [Corynebacterium urinipleomorphum]